MWNMCMGQLALVVRMALVAMHAAAALAMVVLMPVFMSMLMLMLMAVVPVGMAMALSVAAMVVGERIAHGSFLLKIKNEDFSCLRLLLHQAGTTMGCPLQWCSDTGTS